MLSRLRAVVALMRNPKVGKLPKFLVVAAVLYLLDPLDILPDAVPVIGWLDDAAFFLSAISFLLSSKPREDASAPGARGTVIDVIPESPGDKSR